MWDFRDNVAHNNEGAGIKFWFNNSAPHLTQRSITYANDVAGIETGAYRNSISHADAFVLDGILHHSNTSGFGGGGDPDRGAFYDRVEVHVVSGPALKTAKLRRPPLGRLEWIDCIFDGFPKVQIGKADHPIEALFRRCGLEPADIVFKTPIPAKMNGSTILVEENGRRWNITIANQQRIVTEL